MSLDKYIRKKQNLEEEGKDILRLSIGGDGGEVFEFEKLSPSKYFEIQGRIMESNETNNKTMLAGICIDLMYHSCSELRENFEELREMINKEIPYAPDIVKEFFSAEEISAVGAELMEFNGMTRTDIVKKV